jgi:UDP-GlcNAc3NAcA epimerase
MKKIGIVIGARPQFIKHAPLEIALKKYFDIFSIHTGQHYDQKMSDVFFDQLNINKPKYMLNAGTGNHGQMTGLMLTKIEEVLLNDKPDAMVVYGDTNSTLAGALAASKLHIPIIHVEAGLRSFNREMPEEINRLLTDHISNYLFAPTNIAVENLKNEGIDKGVYQVGDVMYDALLLAKKVIGKDYSYKNQILVTLHRPYNTDVVVRLKRILYELNGLNIPVIFPIHPRTKSVLDKNAMSENLYPNICFIDPVSYFDLVKLQLESSCIITDSGGIQKEAYLLKKKCITLRSETEWVETLENGWNTLVYDNLGDIRDIIKAKPGEYIEGLYGNGKTAITIASILKDFFYIN